MRLTNFIRDAFVNAAMADVPSVDYHTKITTLIHEDIVNSLPETVKEVYKNPKTSRYINRGYTSFEINGVSSINVPMIPYEKLSLTPKARAIVLDLVSKQEEQHKKHRELRGKLHGAAYACTTRKALVELLPEFEKYLPADEAKAVTKNLPAVANILSDFVKAGWPKNQKRITI